MTPSQPLPIRDRIVEFFRRYPNETFKPMVLARRLSLKSDEDIRTLRTELAELERAGEIARASGGRYRRAAPPPSNRLTGLFRAIRQGQGIVETGVSGADGKILITQKFRGTAIDGDTVEVSVFARPAAEAGSTETMPEGEIVRVVSRRTRSIIGTFEKGKNFFFVIPDSSRIGRDIYIPQGKTGGARPGEKVAARILSWESANLNPEGEIVNVLGKAGEVHVEMKGIREEFQLPDAFPAPVAREVEKIPDGIPEAEIAARLDLRELASFTIDPADAKDHDDALSIRPLPGGGHEVGVHIADVSHYVTEGSALDDEALARGTSVYLPGTVIPMLPERLSADLCSLMADADRLAYSVLLEFAGDGTLRGYSIRKTVIHCVEGLSYEEAQKIIDTGRGPVAAELGDLHRISRILLDARMREGSIDFDSPEVAFRFDATGLPSEIVKKERLPSHRLIEEFMLMANQVVAGHIGKIRKGTAARPFVYRVHDYPDPERLRDFSAFVSHLGHSFNVKSGVTSRAFQKLLASVRGKDEENVVNELAIRSMAKAVYSEKNIGHFGLAFRFYTHFTSPIRRYPDLIVHRLLHEYESGSDRNRVAHWEQTLPQICAHSSARERIATEAERASVKVMQVEYMKRHVGDVFEALVSGVTNFGLFVEINDLLVEGLIRLRDLRDDYYVFDEKRYQLVGRRTKQVYRLGDKITVQVVRVDPEDREIDFVIVEQQERGDARSAPRKPAAERTGTAPRDGSSRDRSAQPRGDGRDRSGQPRGDGRDRSRGQRKGAGPQSDRRGGGDTGGDRRGGRRGGTRGDERGGQQGGSPKGQSGGRREGRRSGRRSRRRGR